MNAVAAKHTSGPWAIEHWTQNDSPIYIGPPKPGGEKVDEIVCTIEWDNGYKHEVKEKRKADARLIAAAPCLLASLTELVDWIREGLAAPEGAIPDAEYVTADVSVVRINEYESVCKGEITLSAGGAQFPITRAEADRLIAEFGFATCKL